jgi:hypothetical protein
MTNLAPFPPASTCSGGVTFTAPAALTRDCFLSFDSPGGTFAEMLDVRPIANPFERRIVPASRASTRRLDWRASMLFDPLTLVAVLGQHAKILTVETAAALGVVAAQVGRTS